MPFTGNELIFVLPMIIVLNLILAAFHRFDVTFDDEFIYIKWIFAGIFKLPLIFKINKHRIVYIKETNRVNVLSYFLIWFRLAVAFAEVNRPVVKIKCRWLVFYLSPEDVEEFLILNGPK